MKVIGFYAGSFDPFTNGHLAIVKKASKCLDQLVVGIGQNTEKTCRVDKKDMKLAIEETIKQNNLDNVNVIIYDNLTTDAAIQSGAEILVRGLRNGTDYQYEEDIASINEKIANLDTCYFRAGRLGYISSSMVMELFNHGKEIEEYVPQPVAVVLNRFRK